MDTTTVDFNTLTLMATVLLAVMGSTVTIVTMMLRQFNHLDTKIGNLDTRVARLENAFVGLETRFDNLETRFDNLETRFDNLETKFDRMASDGSDMRERIASVEGHLMAPGDFSVRGLDTPARDEPSADEPGAGHREAG